MVKEGDKVVPPDNCGKCGFRLKGFAGFSRWVRAAIKVNTPKKETKKEEEGGFFSELENL